jgi:hypothetical protein
MAKIVTRTRLSVIFIRTLLVLLTNDAVRPTANIAAVKQTFSVYTVIAMHHASFRNN